VYTDRLKGYKYALIDKDLAYNPDMVIETNLSTEAGFSAADKILQMDMLPDGIFVSNDACSVSVMQALKQAGIFIAKDIAVVGFNNDLVSKIVEPNLTTVNNPGLEMGEVAAQNLINHLNGTNNINTINTIILRSELVIRKSSLRHSVSSAK